MDNDIQIVVSPEVYIMQIKKLQSALDSKEKVIQELIQELGRERSMRQQLEEQAGKALAEKEKRKSRVKVYNGNYDPDFKSDGKRKARPADSIRSYDDFKAIQQYYMSRNQIRDWAMWTIGVSLGLRISDLLSLKFGNLIENDKHTFKPRIQIIEQKTQKINNCLITDSVKNALITYLNAIKWEFDLDGYLFPSKKTKGKMYEECGWRILSDAGKALNLPLTIGSHTMRKSFANIAACVDKSCVDMNSITKVQGLLNHSDQKVTMKYLNTYQDMFDRARVAVSDFVLGKSNVNEIIAGNQHTTDDVMERLDAIEKILVENKGVLS